MPKYGASEGPGTCMYSYNKQKITEAQACDVCRVRLTLSKKKRREHLEQTGELCTGSMRISDNERTLSRVPRAPSPVYVPPDFLSSQAVLPHLYFRADGAACFACQLMRCAQFHWERWAGVPEERCRIPPPGMGKSTLDGLFGRLGSVLRASVSEGRDHGDAASVVDAIDGVGSMPSTVCLAVQPVRDTDDGAGGVENCMMVAKACDPSADTGAAQDLIVRAAAAPSGGFAPGTHVNRGKGVAQEAPLPCEDGRMAHCAAAHVGKGSFLKPGRAAPYTKPARLLAHLQSMYRVGQHKTDKRKKLTAKCMHKIMSDRRMPDGALWYCYDRRGHHVTKAEKDADPDAKCEMCSEEPCDCNGDLLTISQIDSWIHTGQHGAPSVNASGETEAEVAAQ
eukprot:g1590.t1